jgi:RNA polymerase subunit RPABC4/transcription elongation factor Spt4
MKRLRIYPLLKDIVQSGLTACDGIVFDTREQCPVCRGKLSGYDTKKKQFAVMQEADEPRAVHVFVKRFACRQCHAICFSDEPFYPDTRIGSPLVDLCRTLGTTMPFNRIAVNLLHLGVVIDRGTVRNYMQRTFPDIPTADLFGIHLPVSILSLADLATRYGEGGRIPGTETLAACGFPSAYRAAPDRLLPPEKRNERNEEEDKEERETQAP